MNLAEEESFPRGSRKVTLHKKRPRQDDLFLLHNSKKVKKSSRSKKNLKETVTDEVFHNSINVQGTLSYSKIQEGMVILGCVRHITNFSLEIEFPGLTFGFVHITNISDIFTKHLSNRLEENEDEGQDILRNMFKIGQFVAAKVIEVKNEEKGTKIKCSLNPADINYEKSHNSFKKGMLVWACVQSILDHGYQLSLGVKNSRVFLPSKNVDDEKVLSIGEPLWCTVHKSESTNAVTTLRVSSKTQHIQDTKIEDISSLYDVIPGMQIELVTEKITSDGIQGKFFNNFFGYVDQTQLKSPLDQLNAYKEGKLLTAFVLYIEPSTKITHFTLRGLDPVPPLISHNVGDIVSAKVISKAHNGIYMKLSSNEKCFVTNKRLIHALSKNTDKDLFDAISKKFTEGSKHACRILDYSRMSKMYIGAVDKVLVQEQIFNKKDLTIGQLVSVTIDAIKSDGIVVTCGHVRGFVPNLHISNAQYSDNLKKKFREDYKVKARIISTEKDNVIFTLKSGLVESEKCLTSLEQVKRGNQYSGVVVQTKPAGVLVAFYSNILGWLSRHRLDSNEDDTKIDPTEYFYIGQVITPWVLGVKNDKVILTLKPPPIIKNQVNIKVGQKIRGIVRKVYKDRIDVKSSKGTMLGTVPINHLSMSPSLSSAFLRTFKPGDTISDLLCISNKTHPYILSRRECLANNRNKKINLKNFENLRPGNLLRCSYASSCDTGIYVLPLILNFSENVLVKKEDSVTKGQALPKFAKDQSILAKILSINHLTKDIRLTIKHNEVFDNSVETVVSYFNQYLGDIKYLRDFGYTHDWDICHYRPGERVMCQVEQLGDEGGCLITLPNKVKGLVPAHLCPDNLKPGQSLEGVFLAQDFKDQFVEVCLRSDISQKINHVQDGVISITSVASCMVEKVLVKPEYILGVLKQIGGNKQLVYMPLHLNENDKNTCLDYYEKNRFKICICGKVSDYLIGISKQLFLSLDKQKFLVMKKISVRQNNGVQKSGNTKELNHIKGDKSAENISLDESSDIEMHTEETENSTTEEDLSKEECSDCNVDSDNDDSIKEDSNQTNFVKNIKFGDESVKNFSSNDSITGPLPVVATVSPFFNKSQNEGNDLSSDEEEEVEAAKKKRKLTNAERAELHRKEEERLLQIEKELLDPTRTPENAEQFDRLMLANPNSSELWTRYITFYITTTEVDKARSVARRALETIDITLVNEKFNIWIVLLNLENLYGTKESFDSTFEEAIKFNDPMEIYLNVIKMLSETEKFTDMEEKIKKVRNKYKQEPTMWLEVAKIYYTINKIQEARNMKDAALKSIMDKKTQLNLIIRFAIMEFKYGEEDQGAAIFETILNSDPKKVNVWTIYVDQLVKKDRIEQARKVLERSICQRLPLKSMKTLFLKFKTFEEQYGTPDSAEALKLTAAEYVSNAIKH